MDSDAWVLMRISQCTTAALVSIEAVVLFTSIEVLRSCSSRVDMFSWTAVFYIIINSDFWTELRNQLLSSCVGRVTERKHPGFFLVQPTTGKRITHGDILVLFHPSWCEGTHVLEPSRKPWRTKMLDFSSAKDREVSVKNRAESRTRRLGRKICPSPSRLYSQWIFRKIGEKPFPEATFLFKVASISFKSWKGVSLKVKLLSLSNL